MTHDDGDDHCGDDQNDDHDRSIVALEWRPIPWRRMQEQKADDERQAKKAQNTTQKQSHNKTRSETTNKEAVNE